VVALSRDAGSPRAESLLALGNVSILEGTFADEKILREGFRQCDGAYVNIDGFNTGEKTEANGHRMGAAIFTSGPYMEMAFSPMTPMVPTIEDGVMTWRVPLGKGAVVHVSLEDCSYYVRWLFDNPDRANGMDLEVAIEHVRYADLAAAFEKVTGHSAQYIDTDFDVYFGGPLNPAVDRPAGYNADPDDKSTMSFRESFTGFWNMWKYDVIKRGFALLDEIHPNRIKTVEQWLLRQEELGRERGTGGGSGNDFSRKISTSPTPY